MTTNRNTPTDTYSDDEDALITGYDPSNPFTREDWFAEQATKVAGDWEPDLWD